MFPSSMSKKRTVEPTKKVDDGSNDALKENVKAERESRRKIMGSMTNNDEPTMMTTGQTAVMTAMISDLEHCAPAGSMKTLTVFAVCETRIFLRIDGVACLNRVLAKFDFIVS